MGEFRTPPVLPGPSGIRALRYRVQLSRDPVQAYAMLQREYGDAVRIPLSPNRALLLLGRPEYAEHVLVQFQDRYARADARRPLKASLGDGLVDAEGAVWQRHCALAQPMFIRRHVQSLVPAIVDATRNHIARWTPGTTIDIPAAMRALAMDVIGHVLCGTGLSPYAAQVGRALTRLQSSTTAATPTVSGLRKAAPQLESLITEIVDARICAPHEDPSDMLDILLAAGPDEWSRTEIQDELLILIVAECETTANALTWALALLSRHPAMYERLIAEADEMLDGRDPQPPRMDALPWAQAVVSETLRLFPPAWHLQRNASVDDYIWGVPVSAGDTIVISPYLLHRHPEFWPEPERFEPQRFLRDRESTHQRYAYLPFGAGRGACAGTALTKLELTLALAVLSHSARLDLKPVVPVRARADVMLHAAGPMLATAAPIPRSQRSTAESGLAETGTSALRPAGSNC